MQYLLIKILPKSKSLQAYQIQLMKITNLINTILANQHLEEINNPPLKLKIKSHTYPCHICLILFGLKGTLTKHIKSVHEMKRPYQCLVCTISFYLKEKLEITFETSS